MAENVTAKVRSNLSTKMLGPYHVIDGNTYTVTIYEDGIPNTIYIFRFKFAPEKDLPTLEEASLKSAKKTVPDVPDVNNTGKNNEHYVIIYITPYTQGEYVVVRSVLHTGTGINRRYVVLL